MVPVVTSANCLLGNCECILRERIDRLFAILNICIEPMHSQPTRRNWRDLRRSAIGYSDSGFDSKPDHSSNCTCRERWTQPFPCQHLHPSCVHQHASKPSVKNMMQRGYIENRSLIVVWLKERQHECQADVVNVVPVVRLLLMMFWRWCFRWLSCVVVGHVEPVACAGDS